MNEIPLNAFDKLLEVYADKQNLVNLKLQLADCITTKNVQDQSIFHPLLMYYLVDQIIIDCGLLDEC
jgi:hypothetical protein